MNRWLWLLWLLLALGFGGTLAWKMFASENKDLYLIGDTTYGHYQIEMACETCHTSPFGGEEILQDACTSCHAEDLEQAHDSHPKKKFTDPRNASRIEVLDARYCVSCHTEHQHEQTRTMGVTLPDDYCYHCHQEVGEERESHKGLPYDSCASAGCHNFHDNRALYEDFLVDNAGQPWLLDIATLAKPNAAHKQIKPGAQPLTLQDASYSAALDVPEHIPHEWASSSHAQAGVNCSDCHSEGDDNIWIAKPGHLQCANCHENEVKTFTEGKHGMRLSGTVSKPLQPVGPADSHMEFTKSGQQLHQSCNACHQSHAFNRVKAAADACLGCHADEHSLSFYDSPHGKSWQENHQTEQAYKLVSCATCHMPRDARGKGDKQTVRVNHNQNFNLRPNEKMIRSVCMDCHGLGFAIDALADPVLIKNNFNGKPGVHIESIDWALKREK
ncbi:cytochrome c3-like protein [Alteromonadaceae bacterium 2753L.S.0a.02]|nr:cytochrome c3-like protein [Alteromonadaceae bacterium 2753L.S.0a.02]